jgi:hypothetical protein
MSAATRAGILPKAIIAALAGTVAGGTAGVWSLRQPMASVNVSALPLSARDTMTSRITDHDVGRSSTALMTQAAPATSSPTAHDDAEVLQRARTLARLPDVTALIALRTEVVRQATERGVAGSPSVKGELDEIDLRLNEARRLRLRLDAEELRNDDSKRSE